LMKGKSQPPKQILNALARESANRAYLQQTLERLKDIATGNLPTSDVETTENGTPKRKTGSKKSGAIKKTKESKSEE